MRGLNNLDLTTVGIRRGCEPGRGELEPLHFCSPAGGPAELGEGNGAWETGRVGKGSPDRRPKPLKLRVGRTSELGRAGAGLADRLDLR